MSSTATRDNHPAPHPAVRQSTSRTQEPVADGFVQTLGFTAKTVRSTPLEPTVIPAPITRIRPATALGRSRERHRRRRSHGPRPPSTRDDYLPDGISCGFSAIACQQLASQPTIASARAKTFQCDINYSSLTLKINSDQASTVRLGCGRCCWVLRILFLTMQFQPRMASPPAGYILAVTQVAVGFRQCRSDLLGAETWDQMVNPS